MMNNIKIDKTEYKIKLFEDIEESVEIENFNIPYIPTTVSFVTKPQNFITPICPVYNKCGNCNLLCLDYSTQLRLKTKFIENLFQQFNCNVERCEGLYYPYKYRNKVNLSCFNNKGKTDFGFIKDGSSDVFALKDCKMHDKWLVDLLEELRIYVAHTKIYSYNFEKDSGILKYVVARVSGNNIMVTLVVTENIYQGLKQFYEGLKKHFDRVSLYININKMQTTAVLAKEFVHKFGDKTLNGTIGGVSFKLSPKSFLQTNIKMASKMYNQAFELLDIQDDDQVLDCFSGIGITSLLFAKNGANVTSIEIESSACKDAISLAKLNGLNDKINVINANCNEVITELPRDVNYKLFVDPPRAGLDGEFIDIVCNSNIKTVVYMSCNPITLLRDVNQFRKSGYKVDYIKPFDMFPHTKHVETLVCLKKHSN